MAKIPDKNSRAKHIGIEIEFYAPQKKAARTAFNKHVLAKFAELGDDGSIDPPFVAGVPFETFELKILSEYSDLKPVMLLAQDFLNQVGARTNESCGLHVHLDMRNVDVGAAFDNLYKRQADMVKSVPLDRKKNTYCEVLTKSDADEIKKYFTKMADDKTKIKFDEVSFRKDITKFLEAYDLKKSHREDAVYSIIDCIEDNLNFDNDNDYNEDRHYDGISVDPIRSKKYQTIEVRFHEGTTDCTAIMKWVKYLYDVAYNNKLTDASDNYIKERMKLNG